jgi:hypothetical protein
MPLPRLHVPVIEPEDVIRHLGHQEKHWKAGRSAYALTQLWFRAQQLPDSISSLFASHPDFGRAELIDAFFERQVDLGTPGRPSQTDLLAVISLDDRIAIMAVEAKAGEPFGDYVQHWLDGSQAKFARLSALCATLNISVEVARTLRYQLLHRAASAILEAERYRSRIAILLVQSFVPNEASFADFTIFLRALGVACEISPGVLIGPVSIGSSIALYAAWSDESGTIAGTEPYLEDLRRYAERLSLWCEGVLNWCRERQDLARD